MKFTSVHHIAIIVSDYPVSRQFYVEKLGFEILRENYRPERNDWKLDLRVNESTELEIFGVSNPPARVTEPEAAGLRHLAFRTEELDRAIRELNGLGIKTEPIRIDSCTGGRFTFFKDPDGLPIELHE